MGLPSLRLNPHLYWGKGDWGAALTGYYIDGQNEDIGSTNYRIGSHIELGLQVSYQLPWDASIVVGASNLLDEGPEVNGDVYGWYPFDNTLYDVRGRMAYIRYNQRL